MRARNVKPGFYKNAELAECSVWARLLAPGLWMMADREGRFIDRPKQIKGEIFPYDNVDVDALLEELVLHQHIIRYESGGKRFIQILTFKEHQRIHSNELPSIIPEPTAGKVIGNANQTGKPVAANEESACHQGDKHLSPREQALRPFLLNASLLNASLLNAEESSLRSDRAREPASGFSVPDWVDSEAWSAWKEMRQRIKHPLTPHAEKLAVGKLEKFRSKGHDPTEILNKSTLNDWKDIYEPKENSHAEHIGSRQQSPGTEKSSWKSEGKRLAEKYRKVAEREEQAAIGRDFEPGLCLAEAVRQDSG